MSTISAADNKASASIYIIRHGQTAMNRKKVLQGRSNLPLNEVGIRQAAAAGAWFRQQGISFSRVYSSPLLRAVQTATLAAGEVPVETDLRLIEMDYGPYEGADLQKPAPEVLAWFRDFVHVPAPEGIESLESVIGRMGDFLETLRWQKISGSVLISTHAIAMKGALEYLTPESRGSFWSRNIGNCAVFRTACTRMGFTVPREVYVQGPEASF